MKNIIPIMLLFVVVFIISCKKANHKFELDTNVKEIIVTKDGQSERIEDELIIDEILQILTNADKSKKPNKKEMKLSFVKILFVSSDSNSSGLYLYDWNSGFITTLAMRKTPYFKVSDVDRLNELLKLNN